MLLHSAPPRPACARRRAAAARRAATVRAASTTAAGAPRKRLGDTAIVVGASFAGLMSAAALAPHFSSVLVLDRDAALPGAGASSGAAPAARRGVAQSAQPHVLFARGASELCTFFPGFGAQLESEGALPIDWAAEFRCYFSGGWAANTSLAHADADAAARGRDVAAAEGEVRSWTCSRYVLETVVRRRVAALPNVTIRAGARVVGLLADGENADASATSVTQPRRVGGVRLADGTTLAATLTVDAAGRGSAAAAWLSDLDDDTNCDALVLASPASPSASSASVETVDAGLRYATRIFARPRDAAALPWKVLLLSHEAPLQRRLGYIAQLEGGRLVATLGGYERDAPPLDDAGWRAFAASLPGDGAFLDALLDATPEGSCDASGADAKAHAATANVRRVFPPRTGLLHVGDAALALCPAYGQGMTQAALSAAALRDAASAAAAAPDAAAALAALPAAMNAAQAAHGGAAWALAAGQDALFPSAALSSSSSSRAADAASASASGGAAPKRASLPPPVAWYVSALRRRAGAEPEVWRAMLQVAHLLRGPQALFAPPLLGRVLAAEARDALLARMQPRKE
jgi:2-polyprenyl-6-methoxyphenol hydroxylase-like FAD-dependent oxidoreductase